MTVSTEIQVAKPQSDFAEFSVATAFALGLALIAMFLCAVPLAGNLAGSRDFVVFWATGQQLIHHANPYDPVAMKQIEQNAGLKVGYGALFMRNPPWALPLVLPLGLVGVRIGALLWSLIPLACLWLSTRMMRRLYGDPVNRIHWLAIAFAPALICIIMGQTALFALLGLVLFLRFHRERPYVAGVSLWLCALKPQLFLPFVVVLLMWIVLTRSYKILAGGALAMAVSCALAFVIEPTAWQDYSKLMSGPGVENDLIPCLSAVMRMRLSPHSIWLQYLPVALACIWAVIFYWQRRNRWDWADHGSLLMLVSVLAAPYCWLYDQGVLIPALLQGAYTTRRRSLIAILALTNLPIEIALMCDVRITSLFYLWTAPAWLAWYLVARATASTSPVEATETQTA
jgi:hypothetical protein